MEQRLTPLSWAEMTLPKTDPEVQVRQLVELYDHEQSLGVYRVCAVSTQYEDGARHVTLEHGLSVLSDSIAPGGEETVIAGSVRTVVNHLLSHQTASPRWQLGECDAPEAYQITYQYGYENLLTALLSVSGTLPEGYGWRFEQRTLPWTLHLVKLSDAPECELRLSRNLRRAAVTVDATDLCTRVYPFGAVVNKVRVNLASRLGQLFVDADTTGTWGVVCQTFQEPAIDNPALLEQIARRYLEKRKQPIVSVQLSALSLKQFTGEALDRFQIGSLCLLPMPEWNQTIRERVIQIHYPDLVTRPGEAVLTLANRRPAAEDELTSLMQENRFATYVESGGYIPTALSYTGSGRADAPGMHTLDLSQGYTLINSVILTIKLETPVPTVNIRVDGQPLPGSAQSSDGYTRILDITPYLTHSGPHVAPTEHTFSIAPVSAEPISYTATAEVMAVRNG